ncbi:unnamed protein product, partial [Mesorhabditis belari]|uniref:G protein-coupled receptor n=1 Tax=Mesorhabditis belari TaxID=2138241 RepID=A0AAF3FE55_9BILA
MLLVEYLHYIVAFPTISLNLLLILLIVFSTGKAFRSYAILLLANAVADMLYTIFETLAMTRVIPIDNNLALVFHGVCKFINWKVCFDAHAISIHLVTFTLTLLPISFWYRYRVTQKTQPPPRKIILLILIAYLPSLLTMIPFTFAGVTPERMLAILAETNHSFQALNLGDSAISGLEPVWNVKAISFDVWLCCPCFPVYSLAFLYRKKFISALRGSTLSHRTKSLQENCVRALTIQACFPIVFMAFSSTYMYRQFRLPGYLSLPYSDELIFLSFSVLSGLSPIVSLYFILPYRNRLLELVHIRHRPSYRVSTVHNSVTRKSQIY